MLLCLAIHYTLQLAVVGALWEELVGIATSSVRSCRVAYVPLVMVVDYTVYRQC